MEIVNFGLYYLNEDLINILTDCYTNIKTKSNRPYLVLAIRENDRYRCIPLSKDNNKDGKFKQLSLKSPDFVIPLKTTAIHESYLCIADQLLIYKNFIAAPYTFNGKHIVIKDVSKQLEIKNKSNKVERLHKDGKISFTNNDEYLYIQERILNKVNNISLGKNIEKDIER